MKVVFILGPTASGKSQLALRLAQKFKAPIINSDSLQFYADLSIGSAAPSQDDFLKAPHFLFHEVQPPHTVTAAWFYKRTMSLLKELELKKTPVVFIVGGTGFYLNILEKGLLPIGGENAELRTSLERQIDQGLGLDLYKKLQELDSVWSQKIKPQDNYRIVRALEAILTTGKKMSETHAEWEANRPQFPYELIKIGLTGSRSLLLDRVTQRTQMMIEAGVISEVQALFEKGYASWTPLKSVGYREVVLFLNGHLNSLDELKAEIIKSTMLLIKKQKTWFKRDSSIHWLDIENLPSLDEIEKLIFYLDKN